MLCSPPVVKFVSPRCLICRRLNLCIAAVYELRNNQHAGLEVGRRGEGGLTLQRMLLANKTVSNEAASQVSDRTVFPEAVT